MEFQITKEELLRPLQMVIGVVDKKILQPILSFVLLTFNDNELIISATDLDIELCAKSEISPQASLGSLLLPAKKLLDICKLLPDNSLIKFNIDNNKINLVCNRSRFSLVTQDTKDFPARFNFNKQNLNNLNNSENKSGQTGFSFSVSIAQQKLKNLLNSVAFAIAQQDVRHYLLGMLWEISPDNNHGFKVVATDGHRLALASSSFSGHTDLDKSQKIVIPRKSINEIIRLLEDDGSDVFIEVSDKSLQLSNNSIIFTTKLLDVKFPDYTRVFPSDKDKDSYHTVEINKDNLKQILGRVFVLSNEKHRAVRLCFTDNQLVIAANNPEQEQAEELLEITYSNDPLEICLNISYFMDVLNKITADNINLHFKQASTPVLITPVTSSEQDMNTVASYIIMPMSL